MVYDPVGGAFAELALRGTAWKGRYLVVGFASGDIPAFPANLMLLKGCQVMGVFWGRFVQEEPAAFRAGMTELLTWYAQGKIRPVHHQVLPLERAPDALRALLNREVVGKVVLTP